MKESYTRKVRSMVTKVKNNDKLLAHLMRRASFGSTYSEIKEISELPYDEIIDSLISPEDTSWMGAHIIRRHHFEPVSYTHLTLPTNRKV